MVEYLVVVLSGGVLFGEVEVMYGVEFVVKFG